MAGVDATTKKFLPLYQDRPQPIPFLTGWCQTPQENYFDSEKVTVDIVRETEDIAIPVRSMKNGPRMLEDTKFVNKEMEPAVIMEAGAINAWDSIKRRPGQDPFADVDFAAALTDQAFKIGRRCQRRANRTIELMMAQVLQGGVITLIDASGNTMHFCDFSMPATHKVTVSTTWAEDGSTGDPLSDIEGTADIVRQDGLLDPDVLIFGSSARKRFLRNPDVLEALDNRRIEIGAMRPTKRGSGATYFGDIWIGGYRFECWEYKGTYKHPQTGTITRYLHTERVAMLSNESRFDLVFGGIPELPGAYEERAMQFLPSRLSDPATGLDLHMIAYYTENRRNLIIECDCRPLAIPTALDTFAYIDCTA